MAAIAIHLLYPEAADFYAQNAMAYMNNFFKVVT